jgi:hypothetical protein
MTPNQAGPSSLLPRLSLALALGAAGCGPTPPPRSPAPAEKPLAAAPTGDQGPAPQEEGVPRRNLARLQEQLATLAPGQAALRGSLLSRIAELRLVEANDAPDERRGEALLAAIEAHRQASREAVLPDRAKLLFGLGHALELAGREPEAQQVWRALVCSSFPYPVPPDPADPGRDTILDKPQDHSEQYWERWESLHRVPADQRGKHGHPAVPGAAGRRAEKRTSALPPASRREPMDEEEEASYREIYPESCAPAPTELPAPGASTMRAVAWWRIAEFHARLGDIKAGPYSLNRAASAYRWVMRAGGDPGKNTLSFLAMYRLGEMDSRQQRHGAALRQLVEFLRVADQRRQDAALPVVALEREATALLATSLTWTEPREPGEDAPMILLDDPVLDASLPLREQERRMRIGLERARDERLVPQTAAWGRALHLALADRYRLVGQLENEADALEVARSRWPLHPDAPALVDRLARVYLRRATLARPGDPEVETLSAKGLETWAELLDLTGLPGSQPGAWARANRAEPDVMARAERLASQAATEMGVQARINAMEHERAAAALPDADQRRAALQRALAAHALAERAWAAGSASKKSPELALEDSFWLTEAQARQAIVQSALGHAVAPSQIEALLARLAAIRDEGGDNRFADGSSTLAIELVDIRWRKASTAEERAAAATDSIHERARHLKRPGGDTEQRARLVADLEELAVADQQSLARATLEAVRKAECGRTSLGYVAWRTLVRVARRSGDQPALEQLRALHEQPATSCAFLQAERAQGGLELEGKTAAPPPPPPSAPRPRATVPDTRKRKPPVQIIEDFFPQGVNERPIAFALPRVTACYLALPGQPATRDGAISYSLVVGASGAVRSVSLSPRGPASAAMAGCVQSALRGVVFDPPEGGSVTLSGVFHLVSAGF